MRTYLSALLVGFLPGCVLESDPATPCGALDLGEAEPATMTAHGDAPVIAVSSGTGGDTTPFVLHFQCEDEHGGCSLRQSALDITAGSALMITSDGRWLVGIDAATGRVERWQVDRVSGLSDPFEGPLGSIRRLVASMRGSPWIVVRDGKGEPGNLVRYNPENNNSDEIASAELGLSVATVGERHLIGRRVLGDGLEDLYLVVVDPGENNAARWAEPRKLIRASTFSRVLLTPGDNHVVATSGEGRDAETFVFSTADGKLVDRFAGAAISGRRPLEDLPGMRAVSPDGSHVAYRTPSGSIALRNLDTRGACMIRGASAGEHIIAGFSAHGLLYIETESKVGSPVVHAFDPAVRRLHALEDNAYTKGLRLAAVPGRHPDESRRPWAVGVSSDNYFAMQPDTPAVGLKLGRPLFMPRDDAALWALNSASVSGDERLLTVRRIEPAAIAERFAFTGGHDDNVEVLDRGRLRTFSASVRDKTCVSTGVPGSWGTQCGNASSSSFLTGASIPPAEDPYDSGARLEPELPALPDDGE